MKAIRIDSFKPDGSIHGALIAESAVRPDRRPLFLPQGDWKCQVRPAIRIDRLGKNIAVQFAARYYNSYALVNYLKPVSVNHDGSGFLFDTIDDAVILGPWQQMPEGNIEVSDQNNATYTVELNHDDINSLIAGLSAYTTFKNGDILILPQTVLEYEPKVNQKIRLKSPVGDSNDSVLLEFTIK